LAGYLGLVPSESSTGDTVNRGGITKAANGRARRILVEAAWSHRHRCEKQMKVAAAPRAVLEIAWKAQMRLCARFRSLTRNGKRPNVVATAIARERFQADTSAAERICSLASCKRAMSRRISARVFGGKDAPCQPRRAKLRLAITL
jgi:Transposase IS116/IS110/IS902 family